MPIVQQRGDACTGVLAQWCSTEHHMQIGGMDIGHTVIDGLERAQQALATKFGEGGTAAQKECVRHAAGDSRERKDRNYTAPKPPPPGVSMTKQSPASSSARPICPIGSSRPSALST